MLLGYCMDFLEILLLFIPKKYYFVISLCLFVKRILILLYMF